MKKTKNKTKTILLSLLVAVLCLALVSGATFALFTSESNVNISLSTGKIAIEASVGEPELYSAEIDENGTLIDENGRHYSYKVREDGVFTNGGTATVNGAEVTLANVTSGDRILVPVTVTNNSSVKILYGFSVKSLTENEQENKLLDALSCNFSEGGVWSFWNVPESDEDKVKNVQVEIALPIDAKDASLQDQTLRFVLNIKAVQSNSALDVAVAEEMMTVEDNIVTAPATVTAGDVTAQVFEGTKVNKSVLTLNAAEVSAEDTCATYAIETTFPQYAKSYEIKVAGLSADNTTPAAISFNVGAGKVVNGVYHKGNALEKATNGSDQTYTYNAETGDVTVYSSTFSPFTVVMENAGTVDAPYLIRSAQDLRAIRNGTPEKTNYYKFANDVTFTEEMAEVGEGNSWTLSYVPKTLSYVSIDGDGHTIRCEGKPIHEESGDYAAFVFDTIKFSEVKNLILDGEKSSFALEAANVAFNNINVYGVTEVGGNNGVFLVYCGNGVTFTNCNNYASVNGKGGETDYNAVFVGYGLTYGEIAFTNCNNYGVFICGKASMFVGNGSYLGGRATLRITNCHNYGRIQATYMGGNYTANPIISVIEENIGTLIIDGETIAKTDGYLNFHDFNATEGEHTGCFIQGPTDTMVLTKNDDLTISFTKSRHANVHHYVVSVGLYCRFEGSNGATGSNRIYVTETIAATDAENYTSQIKALDFVDSTWLAANPSAERGTLCGHTIYELNGTTYYHLLGEDIGNTLNGNVGKTTMVFVSTYDENGELISSVAL